MEWLIPGFCFASQNGWWNPFPLIFQSHTAEEKDTECSQGNWFGIWPFTESLCHHQQDTVLTASDSPSAIREGWPQGLWRLLLAPVPIGSKAHSLSTPPGEWQSLVRATSHRAGHSKPPSSEISSLVDRASGSPFGCEETEPPSSTLGCILNRWDADLRPVKGWGFPFFL